MRFTVDENVHPDVVALLRTEGYDSLSVWDQDLQGAKDPQLAEVCLAEGRVLLTFDLGFGDIRLYPPQERPGIVVLRLGSQGGAHVMAAMRRVLPLFSSLPLTGRLWVVTDRDVRVRGAEEEHSEDL